MSHPTPEELARDFARRWFSHESPVMRELGEKELAKIIRWASERGEHPESCDPPPHDFTTTGDQPDPA